MAYIGDGLISIQQGNNYAIRHTPNNIGWDQIKENNILFIYGHALHYDITKSEIVNLTNNFNIALSESVQSLYSIEVDNIYTDYYFPRDVINILCNNIKYERTIRHVERNKEITKLVIDPLLENGSMICTGAGIVMTSKNKIGLHSTYVGESIFGSPYHVASQFTKNLGLPIMETNDKQYGPLAGLYNRAIKMIDQAVEHSRLSTPNVITKSFYIEPEQTNFKVNFNPPLPYKPQIFTKIYNLINKTQYYHPYDISNISENGFDVKLLEPINESQWTLDTISIPDFTNYEKLFIGFRDDKTITNDLNKFNIEVQENSPVSQFRTLCLYKSFRYKITKIIIKTNSGTCKLKFDKFDRELIANPSIYILPLKNHIVVESGESIGVNMTSDNASDLNITLECEKCN